MGRVLGALVVLLALTGCVSTVSPPEPGFSQPELEAYGTQYADSQVAANWLPEVDRPDVEEITFVDLDDWGTSVVACLADQGFTDYDAFSGGYSGSISGSPEEALANAVCTSRIQVDPSTQGMLNKAELAYLYDYYREAVIPCIELTGLSVLDAPSKADFIASDGAWEPYAAMGGDVLSPAEVKQSPWYRSTPDQDLAERCPPWPPEWQKQGRSEG